MRNNMMLKETEKELKVTNSIPLHNFYHQAEVSIIPHDSYYKVKKILLF